MRIGGLIPLDGRPRPSNNRMSGLIGEREGRAFPGPGRVRAVRPPPVGKRRAMVNDYYTMLGHRPGGGFGRGRGGPGAESADLVVGTRNPKNKHTFQSYLDQIPAMRRTLLGEATARAAYDAELAAAQRVERDRKLDRLQHLIRLRAAKGGCPPPTGPCCATRRSSSA